MEEALERVAVHGGSVVEGRRHRNDALGSEVARITDPDGVRVELLMMPSEVTTLPGEPVVTD